MLGNQFLKNCLNLRWAILLLPLLFFFNNCSQWPAGFNVTDANGKNGFLALASLSNSYQSQALSILQSNCTSCHGATSGSGGVFNLTSPAHLVSIGLVVPGQPSQSGLYLAINGGGMPLGGALSTADQAVIYNWIAAGASASGGSGGNGGGGGSPTPTPTPISSTAPTFSSIKANILQSNCVSCHSGSLPAGGYNFSTYGGVRTAVDTGNPTFSLLYSKIQSGQMPPSPASPLSSDQANVILQWIEAGALNN